MNCPECGRHLFTGKKRCPCGWHKTGEAAVSQRHGLCEYNDHGVFCDKSGSITLHTGAGGPWYCNGHAFGIQGLKASKEPIKTGLPPPTQIYDYCNKYMRSHPGASKKDACLEYLRQKQLLKNLPESVSADVDDEARAEREAIQSEGT